MKLPTPSQQLSAGDAICCEDGTDFTRILRAHTQKWMCQPSLSLSCCLAPFGMCSAEMLQETPFLLHVAYVEANRRRAKAVRIWRTTWLSFCWINAALRQTLLAPTCLVLVFFLVLLLICLFLLLLFLQLFSGFREPPANATASKRFFQCYLQCHSGPLLLLGRLASNVSLTHQNRLRSKSQSRPWRPGPRPPPSLRGSQPSTVRPRSTSTMTRRPDGDNFKHAWNSCFSVCPVLFNSHNARRTVSHHLRRSHRQSSCHRPACRHSSDRAHVRTQ